MIEKSRTVYVLQHPSNTGFLCDSEWDGDSFSYDPHFAYHYDKPTVNTGRLGGKPYVCRRVHLWEEVNLRHDAPVHKTFVKASTGRTRHRYECPRCRVSSKDCAEPGNAMLSFLAKGDRCAVRHWEYKE